MTVTNAVLGAIENQRTTNICDSSRNIGDTEISVLMRLATRVPTAVHLQNWRFIADEAVRTTTFAARQLMFAAQAQGLGLSPMIGCDAAGVAQEFNLGSDEVRAVLVTVGRAADGNWPQKPRRSLCTPFQILADNHECSAPAAA
jgi:nitroreductase